MKGHEHFITCSIVVSKYLVPDRDSNDRIDSKGGVGIQEKDEENRKKEGESERFFSFSFETKIKLRRELSGICKEEEREKERLR